jgi:hypothetical protein
MAVIAPEGRPRPPAVSTSHRRAVLLARRQVTPVICAALTCTIWAVATARGTLWCPLCVRGKGGAAWQGWASSRELQTGANPARAAPRPPARSQTDRGGEAVKLDEAVAVAVKRAVAARLAAGESVIKCPYPLNVLKDTYDYSCY